MSMLPPAEIAKEQSNINVEKSTTTIGLISAFGMLALIFVVARLIHRLNSKTGKIGLDDWLLIVAMIGTTVLIVASCNQAHYGIGRQMITVTPNDIVMNGKWQIASGFSYVVALAFTKLSICALYIRIFTLNTKWFKYAVIATFVYHCLWFVGMMLDVALICRPISRWYSLTDHCAPTFLNGWVTGIFNIVGDVAIIILPQPLLWKLQMRLRKKIAVSAVFFIGTAATVISVVRIPFLEGTFIGDPLNQTYNGWSAIVLTCLEPSIGIICACLPAMPQLFRALYENIQGSLERNNLLSKTRSFFSLGQSSRSRQRSDGDDHSPASSWARIQDSDRSDERNIGVSKTIDVYADGGPKHVANGHTAEYEMDNMRPSTGKR